MAQAGAEPSGGIVQDGLIFRLNGINQGGVPNHWIDEIGGLDFIDSLGENEFVKTGVRFYGVSRACLVCTPVQKPVFPYKNSTFEIVINIRRKGCKLFTVSQANVQQIGFGFDGSDGLNLTIADNKGTTYAPSYPNLTTDPVVGTFSVSDKSCFINRNAYKKRRVNYWSAKPGNEIYIGAAPYYGGDTAVGTIHEIRIYNRQLTEPEILQNQQYDIDTYFGGVTP